MGQVVLFVDDEQKVLESIKRTLHRERYRVEIANGPIEGLQKVKEYLPSVIVTDMRMPEMDGIAFLDEAQKVASNAIYMILSAYSDIEKIMAAINENHVWRYIAKPWQTEDLRTAILNALELFDYREEKKRLLLQLEEKNRQLRELNTQLEERIRERTLQLQDKNDILQLLADDAETQVVMEKICKAIARQLDTSPVFIDVPFLSRHFCDVTAELSEELKSAGHNAMHLGKEVIEKAHIAMPLMKGEHVLGAMLVAEPDRISGFKLADTASNYLSIGSVCLMMAKNLQDTPALNDKINELLGEF